MFVMNILKIIKKYKENIAIFSVFVAPILLVFWPAITGKFFVEFKEGFGMTVHYPAMHFLNNIVNTSGIFSSMWLSNYNSGFPIYLSQLGFWHPIYILFFRVFDYVFAYNLLFHINFILAGIFTYIFSRAILLSKPASVVAGLTFIFAEINMLWAPGHIFSNFIPLIPLFFLSVLKISQSRNWYILLGIFVLALGLLGAFAEIMLLILVSASFFALFLDIKKFDKKTGFLRSFATLKKLALIAAAGIILSLP